jgi:hypothetical protein
VTGPTYSPELLRKFDILTLRMSSLDQMTRINARLDVRAFQAKHGKEVCDAMFEELQRRDRKKKKR